MHNSYQLFAIWLGLCAVFGYSSAQSFVSGPPWKVTGDLGDAKRWNAPIFDPSSPFTCIQNETLSTSNTTTTNAIYESFFLVLNQDTFVRAEVLFTKKLNEDGTLFVYHNSFDPTNPCKNFNVGYVPHLKEGLSIELAGKLKAGTYWFVVSELVEKNETYEDYFAFNMFASDIDAIYSNSTNFWKVPAPTTLLGSTENATCSLQPNTEANYFTAVFKAPLQSQNQTDIWVYLQTKSGAIVDQPIVALYKGDVLGELTGQNFTANDTLDPCTEFANDTLITVVQGDPGDITTRVTATLKPGATYTIFVSAMNTTTSGFVGIFIQPSIVGDISRNANFTLPDIPTNGTTKNCTESTVVSNWDKFQFIARYPIYLLNAFSKDFSPLLVLYRDSFDLTSGKNISTCSTNFLQADELSLSGPVAVELQTGKEYTIVVATKNTTLLSTEFVMYMLTGQEVGTTVNGTRPTGGFSTQDHDLNTDTVVSPSQQLLFSLMTFIGSCLVAICL